jgi:hypothetical protein
MRLRNEAKILIYLQANLPVDDVAPVLEYLQTKMPMRVDNANDAERIIYQAIERKSYLGRCGGNGDLKAIRMAHHIVDKIWRLQ